MTEVAGEKADVVADIDQKAGLVFEELPGFEEVAVTALLVLMAFVVVVVEVVGIRLMVLTAVDMMVVVLMVGMVLHTSLSAERAVDMHLMMLMVADTSPMVAKVVD